MRVVSIFLSRLTFFNDSFTVCKPQCILCSKTQDKNTFFICLHARKRISTTLFQYRISVFCNETQLTSLLPQLASKRKYIRFPRHLSFSDSFRRQSLDQGHNNRLPSSELIKSTVWMCRHVWNLLSSALRSLEWLLMHNFNYRVALNQPGNSCFFFFPAEVKKRLYPLPLHTHNVTLHCLFIRTHRQANTRAGSRRWGSRTDGTSERHL